MSFILVDRDEEVGNDMHWFEELRKIRVAHLKRELEHYDGSIGYALFQFLLVCSLSLHGYLVQDLAGLSFIVRWKRCLCPRKWSTKF